ncbi:hypothetical protein AAH211_11185 [Serratia fonticola]|uniref:hypothetical protein n=1 Tax=Serratia fonticola TaxID=47917 RepID=UPI003988676A
MKNNIAHLLNKTGPCPSSKLVDELIDSKELNRESARKQISRAVAGGEICSLDGLLPKRERFIYLEKQYGSDSYWSNLVEALQATGSAYGIALGALIARGGIMPMAHFPAASGSPIAMKKRLSHGAVLDGLTRMKLVNCTELAGLGMCITLVEKKESYYQGASQRIKARVITESVLIKAIAQWVKNLGIISYDTLRTREQHEEGTPPAVSHFCFDMSAPSYLSPLLKKSISGNMRPGFFACDVLLNGRLNPQHIEPFLAKCRTITSLKNCGHCLFVFVADEYSEGAFQKLKQHGVIPATPENLFGREMAEGLRQLNELLTHLALGSGDRYALLDDIITKLSHIQGVTSQLQGDLFEYLVAELARSNSSNVELGRLCKDNDGRSADCDVLVKNGKAEITFIECKGYKPYSKVKHADIRNWIEKQIPVFFYFAKNEQPNAKIKMQLWTTGKLENQSKESLDKFIENNNKRERYSIEVFEANQVSEVFKATKDPALIRVFEKHFINKSQTRNRIKANSEPSRLSRLDTNEND